LIAVLAFVVMGYHPGLEDDAFYLAAIKADLNPALFPHDSDFFRLQFQATGFDKLISFSVRLTHLPLAWVVLLWQLAAIFVILHSCWRISRRCFSQAMPRWASVGLIGALLTLPVSGTDISLGDQYLHPRMLATAAILAAVAYMLERRFWLAGLLLAIAFCIHALLAVLAISFCAFLFWNLRSSSPNWRLLTPMAGFLLPLGWAFAPASDAWRQAAATRSFYYLSNWTWYDWLGVYGPLALLLAFQRFLKARRGVAGESPALLPLITSLFYYGVFQTIVGVAIMLPRGLERLRPFEPMRYLHLLYFLFFLILGGLLGQFVLKRHIWRWALLFVPLGAGMLYAQRQMYAATEHIELPGAASENAWLQAFAWIRENTPVDSLFALDPHYMQLPGENYHGFRPLAERSVLADYVKDGGMAARVPPLAPRWLKEVNSQQDWKNFQAADFQRLRKDFGVTWVILSRWDALGANEPDPSSGLTCPYENRLVRVCRLY
jgi:Domain of unknown function (DUF6798)